VTLTVANPFSGDETDVRVDDTAFGYVLRNLMMPASGGATTLAVIDLASRGDFSALQTALPQMKAGYATALAGGMTLSVVASEDAPRVTEQMLEADAEAGFLRGAVARGMMEAAGEWPRADVPDDVHRFMDGDTPTLIVAGEFDPATPPPFAEEIARHLPNARVVVFPGGAHSANNFGGLDGIMEEFVRTARVDGLDLTAAVENRPLPLAPGR
jgi:pimeloyl-ACP methyl ester carboxylesterase